MICSVLTQEQIQAIHEASLCILERVGVEIPHPEVLRRFADCGAPVDFEKKRVKIPADLVMRSVAQAGKQFTLYGRDLKRQAAFGQGKRNYNSIAGEALWVDNVGEQRRYASLADVATATRFGDALKHINLVGAMADPQELPVAYRSVEAMAAMLENTTKPIHFWLYDRPRLSTWWRCWWRCAVTRRGPASIRSVILSLSPSAPCAFPSRASTCCSRRRA